MENIAQPQNNRIPLLDIIRGFALFGVFLVNFQMVEQGVFNVAFATVTEPSSVYQTIGKAITTFFFEGKFYLLFSLLFGYGFSLFLEKKEELGRSVAPVFCRRMAVLLLFGVGHVVFLWSGDILVFYALYGFILLLFRNRSTQSLFRFSIILFAVMAFFMLLAGLVMSFPIGKEEILKEYASYQTITAPIAQAYAEGNYSEVLSAR